MSAVTLENVVSVLTINDSESYKYEKANQTKALVFEFMTVLGESLQLSFINFHRYTPAKTGVSFPGSMGKPIRLIVLIC